jgi:hypothetical protein
VRLLSAVRRSTSAWMQRSKLLRLRLRLLLRRHEQR